MTDSSLAALELSDDELGSLVDEQHAPAARKYLTFVQGVERYGVDIERIREIIEYGQVTAVPMAPAHIRGVINLRGHVVPIVDIGSRLGLRSANIANRACNIIVEMEVDGESVPLGFTVQSVEEVVDIEDAKIETAPAFGTEVPSEFIAGMGKVDGDFVTILDISKALAIDALSQLSDYRCGPHEPRIGAAGGSDDGEPRRDRLP